MSQGCNCSASPTLQLLKPPESKGRLLNDPHRHHPRRLRRGRSTLPFGSTPYEPQPNEKGEREIWLDERVANRLRAASGSGESYSDVILRLFEMETR